MAQDDRATTSKIEDTDEQDTEPSAGDQLQAYLDEHPEEIDEFKASLRIRDVIDLSQTGGVDPRT